MNRLVASLVVTAGLLTAGGCSKDHESLILLDVTADSRAGAITTLTLSAPGASQTFTVTGLSSAPTELGLYIPGAVTGDINVAAKAVGPSGCTVGYSGKSPSITIPSAGSTVGPFTMLLSPGDVCGSDAGAGGTSGTGGGSGTDGGAGSTGCTGVAPPAGTPPSLTCCTEYLHEENCAADAFLYTAAFSPDGTLLMTGGDDGRIKLWNFDGTTLTTKASLSGAGYGYGAFSPDGKLVAVGLSTGEIDVWSLTALSSAPTKLVSASGNPYGVAFTPDSQHVVSIDSGNLYVHSLSGGTPVSAVSPVSNYLLAVSPTMLPSGVGIAIAGSDGNAAVYTLSPSGTLSAPVVLPVNSVDAVLSGAFSPDGTLLALGDYDAAIRFWTYPVPSVSTPTTGANIIIDSMLVQVVNGLAFAPNGKSIAVAGGDPGDVSIWDVATRTQLSRYAFPGTSPSNGLSVAFSPNGNALVVGERGCGVVLLCTE